MAEKAIAVQHRWIASTLGRISEADLEALETQLVALRDIVREQETRGAKREGGAALSAACTHRSSPLISMYLISTNSSAPWREPSRPRPDSFTPPNGASSVEMAPELMPTMPYSSASATRQTRPRSRA